MKKVKEWLTWFETFLQLPPELRKKKLKFIQDDLAESDDAGHRKLAKMLESDRFILIGVMPNINYAIFDGAKEFLKYRWIHPMGFHNILVYDTEMKCFLICGSKIRFNGSVINEMLKNSKRVELSDKIILTPKDAVEVEGATG